MPKVEISLCISGYDGQWCQKPPKGLVGQEQKLFVELLQEQDHYEFVTAQFQ